MCKKSEKPSNRGGAPSQYPTSTWRSQVLVNHYVPHPAQAKADHVEGGNHGIPSPQLPTGHQLRTPSVSIVSPSVQDHTHLPHTPAHTISSASTCATPKTAGGRITMNHGGTKTDCGWVVSDSRETCKTNPCSGSRRRRTCSFEGPEHHCSCHLLGGISTSQPECCLPRYFRVYCDVFTSNLSLNTDGGIYLIFVLSHTAFPNDCMRFQESEQWYTIPTGDGRVCCLHQNIHAHY